MVDKKDYGSIALGLYDVPDAPQATVLYMNLLRANAMIVGSALSGKTTMVKNILARMHETEPYLSWEEIYILDFGGNIGEYAGLGRVAACFDNSNDENVKRIFQQIEKRFLENGRKLGGANFLSYQEKHAGEPDKLLRHYTLILENANTFFEEERYSAYQELLLKLSREGISKGVSILMTAANNSGGMNRMLLNFKWKYVLEMPKEKYGEIFGMKMDEPMKIPGRGMTVINSCPCEFQAYLPFENEGTELAALIERTAGTAVRKMKAFPLELLPSDADTYCPDRSLKASEAILGLEYYNHTPITVDFEEMHTIAIYGKKKFGKTNLLRQMLTEAMRMYPKAYYFFFDDSKEQLREFHKAIRASGSKRSKYFQQPQQFEELMKQIETRRSDPEEYGEEPIFMIIQNRRLFTTMRSKRTDGGFYLAGFLGQNGDYDEYYIFTDVPKIPQKDTADEFNMEVEMAFLLDNIHEFVMERGRSSVFGAMESKDLKKEFAPCDIGDAFCYNVGRDELFKFKAFKTEPLFPPEEEEAARTETEEETEKTEELYE